MIINLRMDKVMYRVRTAIFLSFACLISLFSQTTYYVSSSQGNDANSGTSENTPWKTIAKVNSRSFNPGDNVLFKRGDIWVGEQLVINRSGTASERIKYAPYGSGLKPILTLKEELPGWTTSGNWSAVSGLTDVWRMEITPGVNLPARASRLWLDGVETAIAGGITGTSNNDGTFGVCPQHKFYTETYGGRVFVYATSNPATYYSSMEYSGKINADGSIDHYTITLDDVDYITIDGLDVRGGMYSAIYLTNSDYITVTNCNIGKDSQFAGLAGFSSNYVTVMNDTVNSDFNAAQYLQYSWTSGIAYGVVAARGSSYWEIHDNYIKWWSFNVFIISNEDYPPSVYNKIYNNTITNPSPATYGKAVQVLSGIPGNASQYTEVYNNYIVDSPMGIQVCSSDNKFYYNIFNNLRGATNIHGNDGFAFSVELADAANVPQNNYIFNNTMYNLNKWAHLFSETNTFILNNLYINCGNNVFDNISIFYDNSSTTCKNNLYYRTNKGISDDMIAVQNVGGYTVSEWNVLNGTNNRTISGNLQHVGTIGNLINTANFALPSGSPALDAGVDISALVPEGFTDRYGNVVNRKNPNIGAVTNSGLEPTGFKVYLQGSYASGSLITNLKGLELMPKAQPYNVFPWNYNGNESVHTIPSEIIDWVLVELRSDISSSSTIAKRAAFIRSDGSIVDLDGRSTLRFDGVGSDNYYVVIRHRNHLSIMSSVQVPFSGSSINYDFTAYRSSAYGHDLAELGNGKYGMYSGDGDANGSVNVLDYGTVGNKLFQTGYLPGDLDLNGTVNVLDYGRTNQNLLKVSNVP